MNKKILCLASAMIWLSSSAQTFTTTCEDLHLALSQAFNTSTLQPFSFRKMWPDNRTCEFVMSTCDLDQQALQRDVVMQTFNSNPHFINVRYLHGAYKTAGAGCFATVLFTLPQNHSVEYTPY